MKQIAILVVLVLFSMPAIYGQEIIPFPNISEHHLADNGHTDLIDDHNYSLFTEDYQEALIKIDGDIEAVNKKIQTNADPSGVSSLESEKELLEEKRRQLLEEAELIDDLNKFY